MSSIGTVFQLSKPINAFFWASIGQIMSVDKYLGAFRHFEC